MKKALNIIVKNSRHMDSPASLAGFTVVTDGYRLLAIEGESGQPPNDSFPKVVAQWLAELPSGQKVSFAALSQFIGTAPEPKKCRECHGDGKINRPCNHCGEEHECGCDACDGGLVVDIGMRPVRINNAIVDAYKLADFWGEIEPSPVQVLTRGESGRVSFYGKGWRVELMPLSHAEHYRDAPSLEQTLAETSAK